MEKLKSGFEFIFSSYKRTAAILFIAALTLAIPITVSLLGQQQDIRQRAEEVTCQNDTECPIDDLCKEGGCVLVSKGIPCGTFGDADGNGKITKNDAMEVLKAVDKLPPIRNYIAANADTEGDGDVDAVDALMILRYLKDLPVSGTDQITLPVCRSVCTGTGNILCGTSCVNKLTDPNNCGSCSKKCDSGQQCSSGICVSGTSPEETLNVRSTPVTGINITGTYPGTTDYSKTDPSILGTEIAPLSVTVGPTTYNFSSWSGDCVNYVSGIFCAVNVSDGSTQTVTANYTGGGNITVDSLTCGMTGVIANISWTAKAGETSYIVYHKKSNDSTWIYDGPTSGNIPITSKSLGSLSKSTDYDFKVNLFSDGSTWATKTVNTGDPCGGVATPTPTTPSGGGGSCIPNGFACDINANPNDPAQLCCSGVCKKLWATGIGTCASGLSTPTPTAKPTATIAPTATVQPTAPPAGSTLLNMSAMMPGIGGTSGNKTPKRPSRTAQVTVLNSQNQVSKSASGALTFDGTKFAGTINLGTNFASGVFTVKIKLDNTLAKLAPGIQNITTKTTNQVPQVTLVSGDMDGNNILDIYDWNAMLSCAKKESACTDSKKTLADLNDDGKVEEMDLNILLRGFATRNGD